MKKLNIHFLTAKNSVNGENWKTIEMSINLLFYKLYKALFTFCKRFSNKEIQED